MEPNEALETLGKFIYPDGVEDRVRIGWTLSSGSHTMDPEYRSASDSIIVVKSVTKMAEALGMTVRFTLKG